MTQKKIPRNKRVHHASGSVKSVYKEDVAGMIQDYQDYREKSKHTYLFYSERTKTVKDHLFATELLSLKELEDVVDEDFLKYLVSCENIVEFLLRRIETLEKSILRVQYDSEDVIQELIDDI